MAFLGGGIGMGLASLGGAIGIGILASKAMEGLARQPESANILRPLFFIGIAFIESCVLYALVISILLVLKS